MIKIGEILERSALRSCQHIRVKDNMIENFITHAQDIYDKEGEFEGMLIFIPGIRCNSNNFKTIPHNVDLPLNQIPPMEDNNG